MPLPDPQVFRRFLGGTRNRSGINSSPAPTMWDVRCAGQPDGKQHIGELMGGDGERQKGKV
jgi:hypothetical protein